MISRKTLLRNVAGFFVSAKELKERGFKFFKLLVIVWTISFHDRFAFKHKFIEIWFLPDQCAYFLWAISKMYCEKGCCFSSWWSTIIMKYIFSFVSRRGDLWCRSQRLGCILKVFIRQWGWLFTCHLLSRMLCCDWLVFSSCDWCISILTVRVHVMFPWQSVAVPFSCCCVSWSWASMLPNFLFHYPCWCR